jgi:predicted restriction endonuclease
MDHSGESEVLGMTNSEILKLFSSINCARLADGYAPHKPILVLLLLERILNGHANGFSFEELDHDLKKWLEKYGSTNASSTRNEPFWRLKNDGVWDITAPTELMSQGSTPTPNQLIEAHVSAQLKDGLYQGIRNNPELISEIAKGLAIQFVSEPFRISFIADIAPSIQLLDRQYWWVSQNQTYRQEVPGNFMWSPKMNSRGGRVPSYDFMKDMKVGDVVFSFADTYIKAIGVVTSPAQSSVKPDFGNAGANWSDDGWLVDVAFEELGMAQFKPKEHMGLLAQTLPEVLSPIRPDGGGNQIYLAKIPKQMAEILVALSKGVGDSIVDELSKNLEFEPPNEELGKVEEIVMRTDIGETQKAQIIYSRRGQGVFKANVRLVEHACRVTKVSNPKHLIASHIKPWSKSNDIEKLSGFNGLLLSPHIDHLFDKGFISFEGNGNLILSKKMDAPVLDKWRIDQGINVGDFRQEQKEFLEYHRDVVLA